MRLLLTWADRGPDAHSGDSGPVIRLLATSGVRYDSARILTTRRGRAGARPLAVAAGAWVEDVEIRVFDVPDPSDHAQLFAALGPEIAAVGALPEVEVDVLLSAGTPQAQTLWVILVKAGLLRARMLQVIPPRLVPHPHPEPVREVRLDIAGFPEIRALREEVVRLRARVSAVTGEIVGDTPPMRRLAERVARVAVSRVPVLVLGETGTGKELVARAIHGASDRSAGPFVAESCGAFGEGVLTSELFGHEAGAFTGATGRHRGLFEQAHGGTLFLDEVGELPATVQVKLLRVLQEGAVRRVGAEAVTLVDVRIVAATHRDLPALVAAGTFREDLWYRLCGALLAVPPLRERMGDLERLVACFLGTEGRRLSLTRSAWRALQAWRWPGNVRELQAEVRRWTVFCDEVVDHDDLSAEIRAGAPAEVAAAPVPAAAGASRSLAEAVEAAERAAITEALSASDGNISAAARTLAIDRNTLKRKLGQLGLR